MSTLLMHVIVILIPVLLFGLIGMCVGWITSFISLKKLRVVVHVILTGMWIAWGIYCLTYSKDLFEIVLNILGFGVPALLYVCSSESFVKEREAKRLKDIVE